MEFKTGDIVKRKNGGTFSNGEMTVTINADRYAPAGCVWLKETHSHIPIHNIELVEPAPSIDIVIAEETKKLADLAKQFDAQKKIVDHLTTAKALKGGQANE